MLRLHGISKSFGALQVLDDVTCAVSAGERVALVGPNGAGKSTLLEIALGTQPPDAGQRIPQPGLTIGYLAQDAGCVGERALWDELLSAFPELTAVGEELRVIAEALAAADGAASRPDVEPGRPPGGTEQDGAAAGATERAPGVWRQGAGEQLAALVERQGALQERFEQLDGYRVESQIATVLAGLGFREEQRRQPVNAFSGGWQMRIALAKLLVRPPDLLLLDEPTNHLDLAAAEWLEEYLRAFHGGVLVVSHDRYFLDRVATRTLALERGHLVDYRGNYSYYLAERARRRQAQAAAYERQQRVLAEQRAFIERFRASATRSTQAKSRERQIERQVHVEAPAPELDTIKLRFTECPPSERATVTLRGLTKGYGGRTVLAGLDLDLERGQRLGLVGANGAGKSTLLRLLAGRERPDGGTLTLGRGVVVGYHAQDQAAVLDEDATVLAELRCSLPYGWSEERLRSLLGRFLFTGDDVHKRIGVLSGGEKSRVSLARLLLVPCNLLLLDEPTNHLDVPSREALEAALRVYPGTVVVASHDRYFLERVVDRIGALEDGRLTVTLGTYSTWAAKRAAQAITPVAHPGGAAPAGGTDRGAGATNGSGPAAANGRGAVAQAAPANGTSGAPSATAANGRGAGRGNRRRGPSPLTALEKEIAALIARREQLAAALAAPDGDHVTLGQLGQEYAALEQDIAAREAAWEALVEAGEG
ncbi:MAG TPA: ABC-F family ATP-binding cassette domain-containing protein [Chloroflexota bacterium]|nr:ABC-F family ATP-binding cassette domain-containing protein [Chloroflexota bacterium]